jgi:type II secretory pathway pseudopilin PulG
MKYLVAISILVFLFLGCVPQSQYDSLKAELKSTKDQLAATEAELASVQSQAATAKNRLETSSTTLSALMPYVEFVSLFLENQETWLLKTAGQITQTEAAKQLTDQYDRIKKVLERVDDRGFAESATNAWFGETGSSKQKDLAELYRGLRTRIQADCKALTGQLNP